MTYTLLATPDNKRIAIPNSAVVAAQIVNYSAEETRRVEVPVSASGEIPVQKVEDALLRAGMVDNVLADPAPSVVVTAYGEGCVSYSLRLWVKTPDYWDVYFLVNRRVKEILDEEGIRMSYAHLNVHLER
jgi:small conductance mechanosensitive channel